MVAQDTPNLRRLLSEAAISHLWTHLLVLPPSTFIIHLPTDRYLLKTRGQYSTWDGPDSVIDGFCVLSRPPLWLTVPYL